MDLNRTHEADDSYAIYKHSASLEVQVMLHESGEGMIAFRSHKRESDEKRWSPSVWSALTHITTPGVGKWELGPAVPYPDQEDVARDMLFESAWYPTATLTPPPLNVRLERYDVGHHVIYLAADVWYGTVGIVESRKVYARQKGTGANLVINTLNGEKAEYNFAALVPGQDYSRIEETFPGEVRWPIGTAVHWMYAQGSRRGRTVEGVVLGWSDTGLVRVYDVATNEEHTVSRSVLESHILGSGYRGRSRRR